MIEPFTSRPAPKLIFGPGALRELPAGVRELGASGVFLVSDTGIARAGHVDTARRLLESAGIPVEVFARSKENPTESDAAACRDIAREIRFDCIVALGGGSSMDTAKACNFLLTNGGAMRDYHGYGKAAKPMLPFIAIPTTAGTGSECQSYALVSRDDSHEKMACGDPKARARIAILDPELTETQPGAVAIQTGLDALAHALESAVCTRRNAISSIYSEGAFRHLSGAIGPVLAGRASHDDRGHMQLGAALSGLAIENSMLGAAHATANPLTARHNVIHGHAVALMLPHIMRFNAEEAAVGAIYARYADILKESRVTSLPLIDWVAELVSQSSLPVISVGAQDLAALALDATRQWTGQFNPRTLILDDYVALYRRALASHASA
ncbi:MAG: iron-containing alcohol dehydrogenase [Verrucomicrobia bacterium]|nr:iron-containing alcohol dehydrogenase [Verrucomicrobiota bacterium]